jgi:hypothetical protein
MCPFLCNLRPYATGAELVLDGVSVGKGGGEVADVGHLTAPALFRR